MSTFEKNITQLHRCGHAVELPDDFYQRTGFTPEAAAALAQTTDCPDCKRRAGSQPTTYSSTDMAGKAVRKPTVKLTEDSKGWD